MIPNTRGETTHTRLVIKLAITVVAMFGFGYAMVPIYDVICDITGVNGKTGTLNASEAQALQVDTSRTVTVEFVANRNQNLDWEFRPQVRKLEVYPGKTYDTKFFAKNLTSQRMVGQAVPSVAPNEAAKHFSKTECFCFTNQTFKAGESRDMPLRFVVDPRLPKWVNTVSLSYTFFDVTQMAEK